jgi:hypothetical protein
MSQEMTIEPNIAVLVDSFKLDGKVLSCWVCNLEMFAVPTNPRWQISSATTCRGISLKLVFDAPVMRQVECSLFAVIEYSFIRANRIG